MKHERIGKKKSKDKHSFFFQMFSNMEMILNRDMSTPERKKQKKKLNNSKM